MQFAVVFASLSPSASEKSRPTAQMRRKQRKRESTRSKAGKRPWPWNWKLHAELSGCWVNNNKKSQSGACTKRSTAGRWIVKTYDGESNLALPCTDVADLGQCPQPHRIYFLIRFGLKLPSSSISTNHAGGRLHIQAKLQVCHTV